MGLVLVVFLTSLLFGLRGMAMFPADPVRIEHHQPAHNDAEKTRDHQGHCPLCFLQMWLPNLAPLLGVKCVCILTLPLWLGESQARDEFLKAMAARGPP